MGILPIFSAVNIYTAIEKGFFREQGLNIELVNLDTAAKMTPALTTGELHAGAGAPLGPLAWIPASAGMKWVEGG